MAITLRIIDDGARSPTFNMAADLYLWESCVHHEAVVVRLYQWEPASITIGCMQDAQVELDSLAVENNNIAWIRRPTGGRAVLHKGDITYSCIFPTTIREMGKSIMETYSIISECLIKGLGLLNISCTTCDSNHEMRMAKNESKLPCFLAPNRNEIMVHEKKLVGSAQKRSADAVLQHGSIPLTNAYRDLPDYLNLPHDRKQLQKQLLQEKSTCISEIDSTLSLAEICTALKQGFREFLPFAIEERSWSKQEIQAIHSIAPSEQFVG